MVYFKTIFTQELLVKFTNNYKETSKTLNYMKNFEVNRLK